MNNIKTKITKTLGLMKLLTSIGFVVGNLCLSLIASAEVSSMDKIQKTLFVDLLKVTPTRCVALREGQVCYQHVVFEWQAKKFSEYCLFSEDEVTPVNCWSSTQAGTFKLDFQSAKTKRFFIRAKNSQVELASTQVVVAWVYGNKKRRRANWRLF